MTRYAISVKIHENQSLHDISSMFFDCGGVLTDVTGEEATGVFDCKLDAISAIERHYGIRLTSKADDDLINSVVQELRDV